MLLNHPLQQQAFLPSSRKVGQRAPRLSITSLGCLERRGKRGDTNHCLPHKEITGALKDTIHSADPKVVLWEGTTSQQQHQGLTAGLGTRPSLQELGPVWETRR